MEKNIFVIERKGLYSFHEDKEVFAEIVNTLLELDIKRKLSIGFIYNSSIVVEELPNLLREWGLSNMNSSQIEFMEYFNIWIVEQMSLYKN